MRSKPEKIVPPLPEGMNITERPSGLEFMQRGREKWMLAIQALDALPSTHCLQIDINGLSKSQIQGIKNSIKYAGQKLEYKGKIKFANRAGILYVWSNK